MNYETRAETTHRPNTEVDPEPVLSFTRKQSEGEQEGLKLSMPGKRAAGKNRTQRPTERKSEDRGRKPPPRWRMPRMIVSSKLRLEILSAVPDAEGDSGLLGLIGQSLLKLVPDRDTGRAIAAAGLLAEIEGERAAYESKNYSATPLLLRMQEVLPDFAWTEHTWGDDGRCRTVLSTGLPSELETLAAAENGVRVADLIEPVDLFTGRPPGRRLRERARAADREAASSDTASAARSGCIVRRETLDVCELLNDLPANIFTKAVRSNGEKAWEVARTIPAEVRREYALSTLKVLDIQPQPFYCAGAMTARAIAHGTSALSLPREVRNELFAGWTGLDLKHAQFAFAAKEWDVPTARRFLSNGGDLWQELVHCASGGRCLTGSEYQIAKGATKAFLYSLCFGMSARNLRVFGCIDSDTEATAASAFGSDLPDVAGRLLKQPVINAMLVARNERLRSIREHGGAEDCFGIWIHCDGHNHARSVLAQLAQAGEMLMMRPIVDLARAEEKRAADLGRAPEWRVAAWLHDGAWITCSNRTKRERFVGKVRDAVNRHCDDLGYITHLETE